jgi:hypothetical protein
MTFPRKIEKDDPVLKYSDVCSECLSEFKLEQVVTLKANGDYIHLTCMKEKNGN